MKLVVASDSFKGSISSQRMGEIFTEQAHLIDDKIEVVPVVIADGGEGTLQAVMVSGKYKKRQVTCSNPLFEKITAEYGLGDGCAFVEMAAASGLPLIEYKDGNALITTTLGTGELILDAIQNDAKDIIVTLGGSATNDGGIGCLSALGYRFLDSFGNELKPIGENLGKIAKIDCSKAIDTSHIKFTALTDVDNPLVGEFGATLFYGKQKGAVGEYANILEGGMVNFANVVFETTGVKLHDMVGAGAAGGVAGGLVAFLGATIKSGIESVLDIIDFESKIANADAIITGEGRIDNQSAHGKAISGVCLRAKKIGVPVYAIVGCSAIDKQSKDILGLRDVCELCKHAQDSADSIKNAEKYAKIVAKDMILNLIRGE